MAWRKAMSASSLQATYVILGASLLSAKEGFLWDVKQLQWGSIETNLRKYSQENISPYPKYLKAKDYFLKCEW